MNMLLVTRASYAPWFIFPKRIPCSRNLREFILFFNN